MCDTLVLVLIQSPGGTMSKVKSNIYLPTNYDHASWSNLKGLRVYLVKLHTKK